MRSISPFDRVAAVDWSARSTPSPIKPTKDAIWIATACADGVEEHYFRTRQMAEKYLRGLMQAALHRGEKLLVGFDFSFAYPKGFAQKLTGQKDIFALWDWLARHIEDDASNGNNRFEIADQINAHFGADRPFWGCPAHRYFDHLPMKKKDRALAGMTELRMSERRAKGAKSVWQLMGNGAVGSQTLLGLPMLARLRREFANDLTVWPFEQADRPIMLIELYFSLLKSEIRESADVIRDRAEVRLFAQRLFELSRQHQLAALFDPCPVNDDTIREEGWVVGIGAEEILRGETLPQPNHKANHQASHEVANATRE